MRLIDADALRTKSRPAKEYSPEMLVVGLGYVLDAQTIEPEHGEWELHDYGFRQDVWCSVCGTYKPLGVSNFCPNCGADMREVTNDK